MKRLITFLLCAALCCFQANAQGWLPLAKSSSGGGYTGPGDILAAKAWWSCTRGYNTADTSDACDVCLPADTTCAHITLTSGFAVIPAALSTCNNTTVVCTVKTMFDKSGALACAAGTSCDVTNATIAARFKFVVPLAANGCTTTSLPCIQGVISTNNCLSSTNNFTQAQPYSESFVTTRVGNTTAGTILGAGTSAIGAYFNGANTLTFQSTTLQSVTMSDNTWHAVQIVANGASSSLHLDGSSPATVNVGAVGYSAEKIVLGDFQTTLCNSFTFPGGFISEAGIWGSAFDTSITALNSNAHSQL